MCDIRKCTVHNVIEHCTDSTLPCCITLDKGELIITPTSISFNQDGKVLYVYKVIVPFTRNQLLRLNEVESPDPDAYITAIKYDKRPSRIHTELSVKDTEYLYDLGKRIAGSSQLDCCDWNCHYNKPHICTRCLIDIEQAVSLRQQLTTEKSIVRQYAKIIREKDKEIDDLKKRLVSSSEWSKVLLNI
jgi:hypothetical protein